MKRKERNETSCCFTFVLEKCSGIVGFLGERDCARLLCVSRVVRQMVRSCAMEFKYLQADDLECMCVLVGFLRYTPRETQTETSPSPSPADDAISRCMRVAPHVHQQWLCNKKRWCMVRVVKGIFSDFLCILYLTCGDEHSIYHEVEVDCTLVTRTQKIVRRRGGRGCVLPLLQSLFPYAFPILGF